MAPKTSFFKIPVSRLMKSINQKKPEHFFITSAFLESEAKDIGPPDLCNIGNVLYLYKLPISGKVIAKKLSGTLIHHIYIFLMQKALAILYMVIKNKYYIRPYKIKFNSKIKNFNLLYSIEIKYTTKLKLQ